MKKLILMLLLLCALVMAGCSQNEIKTDAAQKGTVATAVVSKSTEVVIYRPASDGSETLLPEKVKVTHGEKDLVEKTLIALCSTKPQKAIYEDFVPIGTKVLSLKIENGLATADFSKELAKKGQGSYQEMMVVYAIVNTLTEFPEIKKVQILVEGQKQITLGGHMDIEDPLTRNTTLLPENQESKAK